MLEKHNDKGEYDWEIYAWCVRDAMAKAGNFKICDTTIKEKLAYENFMKCVTNKVTVNGKTFFANNISLTDPSDSDKEAPLL